jgi:hypothetical protein
MSATPQNLFNSFLFGELPPEAEVAATLDLDFFIQRFVGSFPVNYSQNANPRYSNPTSATGTYLDFWQRFFTPHATDLFNKYTVYQALYTYFYPSSTPLSWLQWLIVEWWGWRLIPAGYPIARQRQLLADLWLHYQRRNTVLGIYGLLAEFGVHAIVTDDYLYYHGYYDQPGTGGPLVCFVEVLYMDSWDSGSDCFAGEYYEYTYYYTPITIVDENFIMQLLTWERVAGVQFIVEWKVAERRPVIDNEPLGVQGLAA